SNPCMSDARTVLGWVVKGASQYRPRFVKPEELHLESLGLFLRVAHLDLRRTSGVTICIAAFEASRSSGEPAVSIVNVGTGPDLSRAGAEAAAHWCLGVLPVLAHWSAGEHSCLVAAAEFSTGSESFDALLGPIVERGEHDAPEPRHVAQEYFLNLLS